MRSRGSAAFLSATMALAGTVLVAPPAVAAPTCFGRPATIVGTERAERIDGTERADVIVGLNGLDRIFGKGGNDLICGGKADRNETEADYGDVLFGGAGDDKIDSGPGDDQTHGGPGDDVLLAAEPAEGFGDYLWGDAGNDRIVGGPYGDTISPGPGRDRVDGRGAAFFDVLDYSGSRTGVTVDLEAGIASGEGRDRLVGFTRAVGSPYDDVMRGDDEANVLEGGAGDDRVLGAGGDDVLVDGLLTHGVPQRRPGDDVLEGGAGDDFLTTGGGRDTAAGDDGVDAFASAGGARQVIAGGPQLGQSLSFHAGPVTLDLSAGEGSVGAGALFVSGIQHLSGSVEDDVLTGDAADNTIVGGSGDDDLDGGAGGFDTLLHHGLQCASCDPVLSQPVVVDLAEGTVSGHGSDTVAGFELVLGTAQGDLLLGGPGTDYLWAADGDDEVHGRDGDDNLNGGFGEDTGSGGPGFDVCEFIEQAEECESP